MLGNVTLIDDNDIDLFITEKVLLNHQCAQSIQKFTSATVALSHFERIHPSEIPTLSTIIIDLHMPEMNGFDFLLSFNKFPVEVKNKFRIYMLSTTENQQEMNEANNNQLLTRLLKKPLDIREIIR